jgi:glycosyltransferase involved in cell wall biosynthesis
MKLLIVVNVDWFFLSHRLPIALAALAGGYEVHVATTLTQEPGKLESYGFVVHPLTLNRSAAGPTELVKVVSDLVRIIRRVRPDLLHLVTIKPVLLGGLAARLAPVNKIVFAVSGLGHVFVAEGGLGRLRRMLVRALYRFVLGAQNSTVIFQNPDDRKVIESIAQLSPERVVLIPGSGVDLEQYAARPVEHGVPVVLMAARLLTTKGVREYVAAARQLRGAGVQVRFWLVGEPDLANPASIQPDELAEWVRQGDVEVLGHRTDIADLMAKSLLVVLPSYREGLPKVLIEAAACGRAVITTDVPGCRDAIENGVTGVLVPPRDAEALATAIGDLLLDRAKCEAMGRAGRERAQKLFDVRTVVEEHLRIYAAKGAG